MKKAIYLFLCLAIILLAAFPVYAHPGKTDSSGGHTDHETGEYHYHHGYPAHDHYDMDDDGIVDCPYDFDDQTDHSAGHNSNNKSGDNVEDITKATGSRSPEQEQEAKEVPEWVYWIIGGLCVVVAILAAHIQSKDKQLISQANSFRRITAEEDAKVKEGICTLHDALVKKYGEDYLYIISGAKPGDFLDSDFLPHSASYLKSPNLDDYTFYLGGSPYYNSKYHHRNCRYARGIYPVNAYNLHNKKAYLPCSLCPCRLPDTTWVDRYIKLHRFLKKYVDLQIDKTLPANTSDALSSPHVQKKTEPKKQNPYLGDVTYDMIKQFTYEAGLNFDTAQNIINFQRKAAGIPPICFEEQPVAKHPSGGIWDDPNVKINLRDK